jgi:hypothetical protein
MKASYDAKEGLDSVAVWHKDWIGPGGNVGLRPSYELIALFANGDAAMADRGQSDLMTFGWSSHKPTGHNAEKPVALMQHLIGLCAYGIVYDPFLGSGTTMVAAQQLGRKCYGMEISPAYVAVTLERMSAMGLEPELIGKVDG